MKLALVCRAFTFHGGVETATAGLVKALVASGHEVHHYSPRGQRPVPGVVLHPLPVPRLPALVRAIWMPLVTRRMLRAADYDVVQSHERTLDQHVYRAGEGCHRAYLASRGVRHAGPTHRVMLALEALTFRRTPRIVAIARRGAEEIQRLYGVAAERLRVIYNGVDLDRFHPESRERHRHDARRELAVPPDAWMVLFVGSGFARKGLDALIEGFARRADPTSRLVIVGKGDRGPYAAQAARLGVAERLVWIPPRPDTERLYGAADVVALPSRYEPFGNVHLEALASGVPVLASAVAGGAELIEPGRNGMIVEPGDPEAIAEALDRLRAGTADGWATAARRSAEPFTYVAQVAAFEEIYAEVAAWRPLSR